MFTEVTLEGKYKQVPAGWMEISKTKVELGTVRYLDDVLHYAYTNSKENVWWWERKYRILWLPVRIKG
jgi:hypothetical protein